MEETNKQKSFLDKLKVKALSQKNYGGDYVENPAKMDIRVCPNCGAGRSEQDGLTHCAYCAFEFLSVKLTDGITINQNNNSK